MFCDVVLCGILGKKVVKRAVEIRFALHEALAHAVSLIRLSYEGILALLLHVGCLARIYSFAGGLSGE